MKQAIFFLFLLPFLLQAQQNDSIPQDVVDNNMVWVEGGTFQMGCTSEQGDDCDSDEKPTHSVTVSDFYLGKYEVTVAEFAVFVEATNYKTDAEKGDGSYIYKNGSWTKKAGINWRYDAKGDKRPQSEYKHPVIHVSWNDAKAYCDWLSKKTGESYRLPTEAEWEFTARSRGQKNKYAWGSGKPSGKQGGNVANEATKHKFSDWTIFEGYDDGYVYTAPVGQFNPNEAGLYDMTGNVWEWCHDWYDSDYYDNSPSNNPQGPSSGTSRVLRGGSWNGDARNSRVSRRGILTPDLRSLVIGFRLCRTP